MTPIKGVEEAGFTKTHELHLATLQVAAMEAMGDKYRKGASEHGFTRLWDEAANSLVNHAVDEATDQMTYLLTLRSQIRIIQELAREGAEDDDICATKARLNCHLIYKALTGQK